MHEQERADVESSYPAGVVAHLKLYPNHGSSSCKKASFCGIGELNNRYTRYDISTPISRSDRVIGICQPGSYQRPISKGMS